MLNIVSCCGECSGSRKHSQCLQEVCCFVGRETFKHRTIKTIKSENKGIVKNKKKHTLTQRYMVQAKNGQIDTIKMLKIVNRVLQNANKVDWGCRNKANQCHALEMSLTPDVNKEN